MKSKDNSNDELTASVRAESDEAELAVFSGLKDAIFRSLMQLKVGLRKRDLSDGQIDQVMYHLATISKLLEVRDGEGSENVLPTNPGNSLDLAAARQEIGSRLAKLAERRGN